MENTQPVSHTHGHARPLQEQQQRPTSNGLIQSLPAQPRNSSDTGKIIKNYGSIAQQVADKGKEIYAVDSDSDEDVAVNGLQAPPIVCAPMPASPVLATVQDQLLNGSLDHERTSLRDAADLQLDLRQSPLSPKDNSSHNSDQQMTSRQDSLDNAMQLDFAQRDSPLSPEQHLTSEVGSPELGAQQVPLVTVPHHAQQPIVPRLVFQSLPKASTSKQTLDDPPSPTLSREFVSDSEVYAEELSLVDNKSQRSMSLLDNQSQRSISLQPPTLAPPKLKVARLKKKYPIRGHQAQRKKNKIVLPDPPTVEITPPRKRPRGHYLNTDGIDLDPVLEARRRLKRNLPPAVLKRGHPIKPPPALPTGRQALAYHFAARPYAPDLIPLNTPTLYHDTFLPPVQPAILDIDSLGRPDSSQASTIKPGSMLLHSPNKKNALYSSKPKKGKKKKIKARAATPESDLSSRYDGLSDEENTCPHREPSPDYSSEDASFYPPRLTARSEGKKGWQEAVGLCVLKARKRELERQVVQTDLDNSAWSVLKDDKKKPLMNVHVQEKDRPMTFDELAESMDFTFESEDDEEEEEVVVKKKKSMATKSTGKVRSEKPFWINDFPFCLARAEEEERAQLKRKEGLQLITEQKKASLDQARTELPSNSAPRVLVLQRQTSERASLPPSPLKETFTMSQAQANHDTVQPPEAPAPTVLQPPVIQAQFQTSIAAFVPPPPSSASQDVEVGH